MSTPKQPKLRPEVEDDLRAVAEGDLHRLSVFRFLGRARAQGLSIRTVPKSSWTRATHEGFSCAHVRCHCGAVAAPVEVAAWPKRCPGCQRWFFYDGTGVWVLNTPSVLPSS